MASARYTLFYCLYPQSPPSESFHTHKQSFRSTYPKAERGRSLQGRLDKTWQLSYLPNHAPVVAQQTQHSVATQNKFNIWDYETDFPNVSNPHNPSFPRQIHANKLGSWAHAKLRILAQLKIKTFLLSLKNRYLFLLTAMLAIFPPFLHFLQLLSLICF